MYGYGYINTFRSLGGGVSLDPDAQAFITAASITDPTQQSAVNQLVLDLKSANIWTKMKAVYPFVGGTAVTTKWNLKDPRDLDAAYRITWSGGLTYANTGVTPNGINGYGYTWFNQSTNFNSNTDASIGIYLRTNTVSDNADMGAGNTTTATDGMLIYSRFSNTMYGCAMASSIINSGVANTDSRGFFAVSRISGVHSMYKRGTSTINSSETEAATSPLNGDIRIGSGNPLAGGSQVYSNREMAFAYIGDGLTQAQIDNLYTAVQTFQTTLSRNV